MDPTVPKPAALLLDFVGSIEAPKGYNTLYGNAQDRTHIVVCLMDLGDVIAAGPDWSKRFGSSACGRYQFMTATLKDLRQELKLRDTQMFDAGLQDRLGFHLLRRRGYDRWIAGTLSTADFMLALAKEWASFPVPATTAGRHRTVLRGETFYAGDEINRALVAPIQVEACLARARAAAGTVVATPPTPKPAGPAAPAPVAPSTGFWARLWARFFPRPA